MNDEILSRIAHALERLAPSALPPVDLKLYPAYVWHGTHAGPVEAFLPARYDLLSGIDEQKGRLLENTRRHAAGLPAHDVLLWGARGTGKSASVGAVVARIAGAGQRRSR
jgi:predicted AAA+ superfamily ATPase